MACLRTSHTVPDSRDSLTMQVMRGIRLSMLAFRSPVGIGSRAQLFVGDIRTRSRTVSSDTGLKHVRGMPSKGKKSLSIGQESSLQRMSLILSEKNLQNASGSSGREMPVGRIWTTELPMSWLETARSCLLVGGQMESVDLDPLLDIDGPVLCETRCPPATLCLPLPAFGFLQLRCHPWSGGSVNDVTGGEGAVLI